MPASARASAANRDRRKGSQPDRDPNGDREAPPEEHRADRLAPVLDWFARQGWTPLPFQRETWAAHGAGRSGLVQVPTGSGKTYAAVMGPIADLLAEPRTGLQLLYLTPLRALSRDIERAIARPIADMGWPLRVECRTGDTPSSQRSRQRRAMPDILITTPESLAVLLARKDARKTFAALRSVVVDEWHELLATKRGTQVELGLARLRHWQPTLQTWALSATLANPEEAARAAVGRDAEPVLVRANLRRETAIATVLPAELDGFPWAGHLGLRLFDALAAALDRDRATLIFTNTRSQAERWYQALTYALPDFADRLALHHGSIDRGEREAIEAGVKAGDLKWVVCTSSLDLGVDFQPVDRVVQIGSAKSLARLLQRAGRSAHVPEGVSELLFLPTNALELLEIVAFRWGLAAGRLEARRPLPKPYDVLLQHLVTLACGDGFEPESLLAELRGTVAYGDLSDGEFNWMLEFLERGGKCLKAYPRYQKLRQDEDGTYRIADTKLARMHRMGIGTIVSESVLRMVYTNRKPLGTVEERFVSKLKKGDTFFFGGKQLEFVMLKDNTVYVKQTSKISTVTPIWKGGTLAMSDCLSEQLRLVVDGCRGKFSEEKIGQGSVRTPSASSPSPGERESELDSQPLDPEPELACLEPLLAIQARVSRIPAASELALETCQTRDGRHFYAFPFEGRSVHEGLAVLWGYRFARQKKATFAIATNEYGFHLLGPKDYPFEDLFSDDFFETKSLEEDLRAGLNLSELTQRQFRGIAQIAGLTFKGYPSARKTATQLQVSSSLLYEVFCNYEPDNLLLQQAEAEVLRDRLELPRLAQTLDRLRGLDRVWSATKRPSPFAFPLLVERLGARLSNESLLDRVARLKQQWEKF